MRFKHERERTRRGILEGLKQGRQAFGTHGGEPFAQDRLERQLPARLNRQFAPKRRQAVQTVASEPFRQLALVLDLVLQLHQGIVARAQLGAVALRLALFVERLPKLLLGSRKCHLELELTRAEHFDQLLDADKARFALGKRRGIRPHDCPGFLLDPRSPHRKCIQRATGTVELGFLDTQLLLGLRQFATRRIRAGFSLPQRLFHFRKASGRLLVTGFRLGHA